MAGIRTLNSKEKMPWIFQKAAIMDANGKYYATRIGLILWIRLQFGKTIHYQITIE